MIGRKWRCFGSSYVVMTGSLHESFELYVGKGEHRLYLLITIREVW